MQGDYRVNYLHNIPMIWIYDTQVQKNVQNTAKTLFLLQNWLFSFNKTPPQKIKFQILHKSVL